MAAVLVAASDDGIHMEPRPTNVNPRGPDAGAHGGGGVHLTLNPRRPYTFNLP